MAEPTNLNGSRASCFGRYSGKVPTFSPYPWNPDPAPSLVGPYATNDRLDSAQLLGIPSAGPEDVVVDRHGYIYTGTDDGSILVIEPIGRIRQVADVGGRPLGIEWLGPDLLVCNAYLGLQRVSMSGAVDTLVDSFDGAPLLFTNNASVAADGTIYFTDTSQRWQLDNYTADLVEGQPTGRLFRRSVDGSVTVLVDGLQFANGVALAPDESSLFVAETGRYRIHRHWLKGNRAGTTEVFADNLPGFPDNLSFGGDTLWVAHASPRQKLVDIMASRAWMRSATHRLPTSLKPKPVRHGMVFGYDLEGAVTHNFQGRTGRLAITTSARFHDGRLYVGVLTDRHLAVLDL